MRWTKVLTLPAVLAAMQLLPLDSATAGPGPGCELRGQVASSNSSEPLTLTFQNAGSAEYYVYWIDQSGRENDGQGGQFPMLTVAPGSSGEMQTFAGHYFSVFDGSQNCLGVVMASGNQAAVVLPAGATAGSEQSAEPNAPEGETQPQSETAAAPASQGGDLAQIALDTHNRLRAKHCVPPLAWSARLAATAQQWANGCEFSHSNNGLGENLAMGTSGAFPPDAQIQSWYDEIARYNFAAGRFTSGTGHFTQVVWRATTELGCGVATCGGEDLLVCNYSPPGNFQGEFLENVPAPCE